MRSTDAFAYDFETVDSYSSIPATVRERVLEARQLYRRHTRDIERRVASVIAEMEAVERSVRECSGLELRGAEILDVGPGQNHGHMYWLAVHGRPVGIDLDISPEGWRPGPYLELLRRNGFTRLYKTLGRKLLGLDRRFRAELARQLDVSHLPRLDIRRMDATRMFFPDGCFDAAFSRSVFEHIADPEAALAETVRILRPGGCAHVVVHLWTSDSGCHDPRILGGSREGLPLWSHLRKDHAHRVRPNSWLNRLRLADWRAIVARQMPGAQFVQVQETNPRAAETLGKLRASGELEGYADEELLSVALQITFAKP